MWTASTAARPPTSTLSTAAISPAERPTISGTSSRWANHIIFGLYPTALIDWFKTSPSPAKAGCIFTDVSGIRRRLWSRCRPCREKVRSSSPATRWRAVNFSVEHAAGFAPALHHHPPREEHPSRPVGKKPRCWASATSHPDGAGGDKMIGYVSQLCRPHRRQPHVPTATLLSASTRATPSI